ncbi:hypothetical protein BH11BAC2_BH11BAC2_08960 [soil metagenome]
MQNSPIFLSDLQLLRELFAPQRSQLVIYDPFERLTGYKQLSFTLTESPLKDIPATVCYADLSEIVRLSINADQDFSTLYYINNPDGTIRWIYPAEGKKAGYLSLYNTGTWKGRIYRKVSELAWTFGQAKRLASGMILLQQNLLESVKERYQIVEKEEISFFMGTRGETRKVVMEIHQGTSTVGFVKIPVTEKSSELVKNECDMISELGKYDFSTLSLPRISGKVTGTARISNVKPAFTIPADRITAIHVRAMAELYALSHERKAITETAAWTSITNNMEWMKRELLFTNGMDATKTRRLIHLLRKLFNTLPIGESVAVSVSHGDFTPWNMYCDEQRLYVYDWELARNGIPMLFDLYHFTFQSTILQQRKDYKAVKDSIQKWSQTPLVKQLFHKYKINHSLHLRLYLLFTVSHYIRQYIGEKEILTQSHWMIDAWLQALEDCINSAENSISNA